MLAEFELPPVLLPLPLGPPLFPLAPLLLFELFPMACPLLPLLNMAPAAPPLAEFMWDCVERSEAEDMLLDKVWFIGAEAAVAAAATVARFELEFSLIDDKFILLLATPPPATAVVVAELFPDAELLSIASDAEPPAFCCC